jgi:hypothetical protein
MIDADPDYAPTCPMPTCDVGDPAPANTDCPPAGTPPCDVGTDDTQGCYRELDTIVEPPVTEPIPDVEPIVITITGAERGATVMPAWEDGDDAAYLVPTYVFIGTYDDGSEFRTELVAIDRSYVVEPDLPTEDTAVPDEPTRDDPTVETVLPAGPATTTTEYPPSTFVDATTSD